MKRSKTLGWLIGGAALLAASMATAADDFEWKGTVAPGRAIEIKGVNGDVDAVAASGSQVEVVARKHARRSDPAEVRIEVVEHADGVTICAVYPTPWGKEPNDCQPGNHGHSSTRDNDVSVNFVVKVPAGVRFIGRTVNGGIDVAPLTGDVQAHTVNGGIHLATAGHAEAQTVNGSITATMGRADWSGPVRYKTVNGSITLDLPANTSSEIHASTVNGDIETDFPLTVTGKISRRSLSGTIGSGGRELDLETVNGSIRLRRAGH